MGLALAHAALRHSVKSVVFVSRGICLRTVATLKQLGTDVRYVDGTYEEAVVASQQLAVADPQYFDANPGGPYRDLALDAYADLATMVINKTQLVFQSAWVACGNGTTIAGLRRGFLRCGAVPRLGAVGSLGNSALARSFAVGHLTKLNPNRLSETETNRPLVNWSALDGEEALTAVVSSGGWVMEVSDSELRGYASMLKRYEALIVHPSSAAALAGLAIAREHLDTDAPQLVILTT
jgi:threonine synthase